MQTPVKPASLKSHSTHDVGAAVGYCVGEAETGIVDGLAGDYLHYVGSLKRAYLKHQKLTPCTAKNASASSPCNNATVDNMPA